MNPDMDLLQLKQEWALNLNLCRRLIFGKCSTLLTLKESDIFRMNRNDDNPSSQHSYKKAAHDVPNQLGYEIFFVASPNIRNVSSVDLRSSSFSLDKFAKHLKTHPFDSAYSNMAHTFDFVGCDTEQ